jgi:hypothetical protein
MVRSALRLLSFLIATMRADVATVEVGEADARAGAGGVVAADVGDEDGTPQLAMHAIASSASISRTEPGREPVDLGN